MIRKILKYISIIFIVLIIFLAIDYIGKEYYKGLSQPKLESNNSILEFVKKENLHGKIYIPKNQEAFYYLDSILPNCIIFDKNKKIITHNIISEGGECYQDIAKKIKNNCIFNERNITSYKGVNSTLLLDSIVNLTSCINCDSTLDLKDYDYIIIWGFSIYQGMTHSGDLHELESIVNNQKKKNLLVLVNLDYNSLWFQKEIPKVEISKIGLFFNWLRSRN